MNKSDRTEVLKLIKQSATNGVDLKVDGTDVAVRPRLNLVTGDGVGIEATEDHVNNRINVTIKNRGGRSGGSW